MKIRLTGIPKIDALLMHEGEETTNKHGNRVVKIFYHDDDDANRYLFDFNLDREVWREFDTENDAWYFGVWVNKTAKRIISYVEGDVYVTQCKDVKSFDDEIAEMCDYYESKAEFSVIDTEAKTLTRHYQDRREFFIDPERAAQHLGKPEE